MKPEEPKSQDRHSSGNAISSEDATLDQKLVKVDLPTYDFLVDLLDDPRIPAGRARLERAQRPWSS